MGTEFIKDKRTGVVINKGSFHEYMQKREQTKALIEAKHELENTKKDMANIKNELNQIKELLLQLAGKQ